MRKDSPERLNVVEAETVPVVEGHVYAIVKARWRRSTGVADRITHERSSSGPGRPDRDRWHVADGGSLRGKTEVASRAEVGSRTCS